jgi:tyrosyl-tRNA synthetase
MLDSATIHTLTEMHEQNPHVRLLQKTLAKELTCMVHSEEDYNNAVDVSNILFDKGNTEKIAGLDEATLLEVFEGVSVFEIGRNTFETTSMLDLFTQNAPIISSKGELRKLIRGGGFNINEEKINDENLDLKTKKLIQDKYLLIRKGKKDYILIKVLR